MGGTDQDGSGCKASTPPNRRARPAESADSIARVLEDYEAVEVPEAAGPRPTAQ